MKFPHFFSNVASMLQEQMSHFFQVKGFSEICRTPPHCNILLKTLQLCKNLLLISSASNYINNSLSHYRCHHVQKHHDWQSREDT